MTSHFCSSCARHCQGYCRYFKRPVDLNYNYCAIHTEVNKDYPVNYEYKTPSKTTLSKLMQNYGKDNVGTLPEVRL